MPAAAVVGVPCHPVPHAHDCWKSLPSGSVRELARRAGCLPAMEHCPVAAVWRSPWLVAEDSGRGGRDVGWPHEQHLTAVSNYMHPHFAAGCFQQQCLLY